MRVTNETQTMRIKDNVISFKDANKTYKFTFAGVSIRPAKDMLSYTWYNFKVEHRVAHIDMRTQVYHRISIGVSELYNEVTVTGSYIKELKKANKPVFISGTFKFHGTSATHMLDTIAEQVNSNV